MGLSNSGMFSDAITAQGFPRRRARGASHAHERATRWETRVAGTRGACEWFGFRREFGMMFRWLPDRSEGVSWTRTDFQVCVPLNNSQVFSVI